MLGLPVGRSLAVEGRIATADFWYDVRQDVKLALTDLELFLRVAELKQVDQVLNANSFQPVLETLFWGKAISDFSSVDRAKLAHLSIRWGFEYLREKAGRQMTKSHARTLEEAIDLSEFLARSVGEDSQTRQSQSTRHPVIP